MLSYKHRGKIDTLAPESNNTSTSRPVVSTVNQTCIVLLLKGLAGVFCSIVVLELSVLLMVSVVFAGGVVSQADGCDAACWTACAVVC